MTPSKKSNGLKKTAARRAYGTGCLRTETDRFGNETWYGKWRDNGRQVKRSLGPKRSRGNPDGLTRTQAEAALRTRMVSDTAQKPRPRGPSIAEVGAAYFASRDLKASTRQDYEMHLRLHIVPFLDDRPLTAISTGDIQRLIETLLASGLKPRTTRTYVTTLSTLLNYAVGKGWLSASPMRGVDLPPPGGIDDSGPLRFLHPFEIRDLALSVPDGPYQAVDRALYLTAALSGLRQGELLGLRWEDVDFESARLRVVNNLVRGRATSPKSRKLRSVPLATTVTAELEMLHLARGGGDVMEPVFADPLSGRPLARTPLMRRYRAALLAAGLDPAFRFHDLRHTFGTSMAKAGEPVTHIQAWMGHSDLKTTERYMHYAPARDDAARIDRAFALGDPRLIDVPEGHYAPEVPTRYQVDVAAGKRALRGSSEGTES